MKKGAAAQQAIEEEEAKSELAKAEQGKMFRFRMAPDGERKITFIDGDLNSEGTLDINMYFEHNVKVNGNWMSFVCTQETEPCPICAKGDSRPTLVGLMTVIDHTPYKIQSGQNAGKTIQNSRKLFVCKRQTIKQLTKIAAKRDGLAGATFEVTRGTDKDASVGNQFDFVEKLSSSQIAKKYDLKPDEVVVASYEDEISYRTADELVELGVGEASTGPGHKKSSGSKSKLADEL